MKKSRILGYALTLAATLFVGSAMGQDVKGGNNYVELKNQTVGGAQGTGTLEQESLIQVGLSYGFFAKPSEGFHPGYISTGANPWSLTNGFKWDWSFTASPVGSVTSTTPTTATSDGSKNNISNYSVIKVDLTGNYTVQVSETAPAAFGGCTSTPASFKLIAFAAPSFAMGTTAPTNALCGTNTVAVDFGATINSSGTPTVKFRFEKWSVTVNPSTGAKTPNAILGTALVNVTETFTDATHIGWNYDVVAATTATGITSTKASVKVNTALATATQTLAKYDFKYTAAIGDLAEPTGASEGSIIVYRLYVEGTNGSISRRADYVQADGTHTGAFTLYPTTAPDAALAANYYDVYVAKKPITGPVFHIGNNKAI
jgi:hypothetical protein